MIRKTLFLALTAVMIASVAKAQAGKQSLTSQDSYVAANQCFNIVIFEAPDSLLTFDNPQQERGAEARGNNRGLLDGLWKNLRQSYQSTLVGQIATTSGDILSSGIGLVSELVRSKRTDWQAQVMKECKFAKKLQMGQEIHDFYAKTTTNGAMAPDGMLFDGFGCRQFYVVGGDTVTALYVQCGLKRDEEGRNRILHHGKFEVEVKRMYVNPSICGLPNDSLQAAEVQLRVPFDFKRRKNLKINIVADLSSSWMNQAIQMYNDQKLGEFVISLTIPDSTALETEGDYKGWYVYDTSKPMDAKKVKPTVKGESFMVPRSYIGTADGSTFADVWGTGQYKIDMTLSASCDINFDFYYEKDPDAPLANPKNPVAGNAPLAMPGQGNHKWNRYWSEEWNMMKKRKKTKKNFWKSIADNVLVNYKNGRWVYTILEPAANYLLTVESAKVNRCEQVCCHGFNINRRHSHTNRYWRGSNASRRRRSSHGYTCNAIMVLS